IQAPVVTFTNSEIPINSGPVAPVVTFQADNATPNIANSVVAPVVTFSTTPVKTVEVHHTPPAPVTPVIVNAPPAPAPVTPITTAQPTFTQPATPGGFQVSVSRDATPATGGATGLFVRDGMPDTQVTGNKGIDISVPATAFAHSNGNATVTLAADQANGAALPGWLQFNPTTGKFSGEPPAGSQGEISVRVVARDSEGREAVVVFKIKMGEAQETPPPAPQENQTGLEFPERPWQRVAGGKLAFGRQLALAGREGMLLRAAQLQRAARQMTSRLPV
ncbi:MAG: putative Ig domain-containing protein, partial [Magnetococcales bacterium]|nr:putative Ig domain-containing protein [Magnetococcales bacterium]